MGGVSSEPVSVLPLPVHSSFESLAYHTWAPDAREYAITSPHPLHAGCNGALFIVVFLHNTGRRKNLESMDHSR
jgi:hypothetical protein